MAHTWARVCDAACAAAGNVLKVATMIRELKASKFRRFMSISRWSNAARKIRWAVHPFSR